VPTAYRVEAADRRWYGNCAWDPVGICAPLLTRGWPHRDICPSCAEAIALDVRNRPLDDERLLFHCLVPARHWWDDIIFTEAR